MNLQFMKRSLAQSIETPQLAGVCTASADSGGYGIDGRAATYQEVCDSNPVSVRESNRIVATLGRSLRGILTAVMINQYVDKKN